MKTTVTVKTFERDRERDTHTHTQREKRRETDTESQMINVELHDIITIMSYWCCDMGQNDTIRKIELNPSFVLSSDNTNCKNDIQLFHQLFDELRVNGDCH